MNLLKKIFGNCFFCKKKESDVLDDKERVTRYREVENSPELKEYFELEKIVEGEEFVQKKYNWINKDFKMTETYAIASRYKELHNDADLQAALELETSKRLQDYLKFKASKDYAKLQDKEAVSQSEVLQRMLKIENSKEYKNYLRYAGSELLQEYKDLVAKMDTPEWKKEYAFWSNPNRWKATPEYQQHVRYKQLAKRADIVFYLHQDPKEIARLEKEFKNHKS